MTDLTTIRVNFVNELKDHLDAQRILYRERVFAKLDKVVAVLLVAAGVYLTTAAGLQWWTVIWFPLAVCEWFDLLSISPLRTRIWFRQNPKFREEYFLTISPESLHFKTASIDSTLQWDHYERTIESKELFLLMYGKMMYTLIPKRSLRSEADLSALRELFQAKIPRYTRQ